MPVICISRTLGALGEEVGMRVADATGLRYVDEEIVAEAARRAAGCRSGCGPAQRRTLPTLLSAVRSNPGFNS